LLAVKILFATKLYFSSDFLANWPFSKHLEAILVILFILGLFRISSFFTADMFHYFKRRILKTRKLGFLTNFDNLYARCISKFAEKTGKLQCMQKSYTFSSPKTDLKRWWSQLNAGFKPTNYFSNRSKSLNKFSVQIAFQWYMF